MKATKKERILTWSADHKTKSVGHVISQLGWSYERQFFRRLNRLVREGLIHYERVGQSVTLSLTREGRQEVRRLKAA